LFPFLKVNVLCSKSFSDSLYPLLRIILMYVSKSPLGTRYKILLSTSDVSAISLSLNSSWYIALAFAIGRLSLNIYSQLINTTNFIGRIRFWSYRRFTKRVIFFNFYINKLSHFYFTFFLNMFQLYTSNFLIWCVRTLPVKLVYLCNYALMIKRKENANGLR